jgi:hypothetical protein
MPTILKIFSWLLKAYYVPRLSVVQKSQFSDWCDIAITLELENGAGNQLSSHHVHRKWILLVGGPDNQLIFSFRGNDSLLATTWSRMVRVNARYCIAQRRNCMRVDILI